MPNNRKLPKRRKGKRTAAVKKIFSVILSSVTLVILLAAVVVFVNENFLHSEAIPTSAEVIQFFSGKNPYMKPLENEAAVYFIDVGQGDCELILTDKYSILIDCGEESASPDVIGFIKKLGVNKLDMVIVTHQHSDHMGGMERVLQSFSVGSLIMPMIPQELSPNSVSYEMLLRIVRQKGIVLQYAEAGQLFELDEDTRLEVLAPIYHDYEDLNDFSAVVRLVHGQNAFLFMGDAERDAELDILSKGVNLKADVLKVGHHGSNSSSSAEFLLAVRPSVAVIEVAETNYYGHPHTDVLNRLAAVGCEEIYTTARDGNIVILSDGADIKIRTDLTYESEAA